jgi:hypothetical protein
LWRHQDLLEERRGGCCVELQFMTLVIVMIVMIVMTRLE